MNLKNFNLVGLVTYLLLGTGIYLSFFYAPLVWKRAQLQDVMKEVAYAYKKKNVEEIKDLLIEEAKAKAEVVLDAEDIQVDLLPDRIRIDVIWRPVVVFTPTEKRFQHIFQLEQEKLHF